MADDFSAHKTSNVARLCWQRGYVLLLHGGGQTPVTQTPDTDLNQHVRREYAAKEAVIIIEEMRRGVKVPKPQSRTCIDLMVQNLSDKRLQYHAADGYKKTGANVALDGTEDHEIVREAGQFFRTLNMREEINREIAVVRHEVQAGRLRWTWEDVQSLMQPFPRRGCDEVLERVGDHQHLDEGDIPYAEETAVAEEEEEENMSDWGESQDGDDAVASAVAENEEAEDPAVAGAGALDCTRRTLDAPAAETLDNSKALVAAYEQAIDVLKSVGAVGAMQQLHQEKHKELRRQRLAAKESPAVAAALADLKEAKAIEERQQRLAIQDANRQEKELKRLRQESQDAQALLAKKKKEFLTLESALVTRHALKRYSPETLGQGKPRSGGATARKMRFEVLDRLSKLGTGLTGAQRNDWAWFREAWDAKMCAEHGVDWGGIFAGWIQKVLDDLMDGVSNALSVFVHEETSRCFGDMEMLAIPGSNAEP